MTHLGHELAAADAEGCVQGGPELASCSTDPGSCLLDCATSLLGCAFSHARSCARLLLQHAAELAQLPETAIGLGLDVALLHRHIIGLVFFLSKLLC